MNSLAVQTEAPDEGPLFADLPTEQLLAIAAKTCRTTPWSKYSRDMLLAFFWNRFGKVVPASLRERS